MEEVQLLCKKSCVSATQCGMSGCHAVRLLLSSNKRISSWSAGKRLEESKKINQSLSALGNVIAALTDHKGTRAHIPYRFSPMPACTPSPQHDSNDMIALAAADQPIPDICKHIKSA